MNNPLVSVIVPIYNVENYLRRCIDSIVSQTYRNIEVILIDDGSTDGSRKIIKSYTKSDMRVSAIYQKNKGVSSARNTGLRSAKGRYVLFVDADDKIDKDACRICIDAIKSDEDVILFTVRRTGEKGVGGILEGRFNGEKEYLCSNREIMKDYLRSDNLRICALLFKRSLLDGVRFNEDMRIHEDAVFAFKLLQRSTAAVRVNLPLYLYISRRGSAMKQFRKSDIADVRNHYNEVTGFMLGSYPDLEIEIRRKTASILFNMLTVAKYVDSQEEVVKVRSEIRDNQKVIKHLYRMPLSHKVKFLLSYCPLPIFTLAIAAHRKLKGVE